MIKFTIIVPVYKVEEYLDRCVKSILSQTFTDFELILVDDGSPDNCPQMCDEWAKSDFRIKVVHQENKGVSSARNVGIDIARGERIIFVDSDDFIERNLLEKLNQSTEDYILYGFNSDWFKKTYNELESILFNLTYKGKITYLTNRIVQGNYEIWRACFKNEILQAYNIRFPEKSKYAEDMAFTIIYILACNTIKHINYSGYHYEDRVGSAMHQVKGQILLDEMNQTALYVFKEINKLNFCTEEFYKLHFEMIRKALNYGWYYHYRDIKSYFNKLSINSNKEFYYSNVKRAIKSKKTKYKKIEHYKVEKQKDYLMMYAYNKNKFLFKIKFGLLFIKVLFIRVLRKIGLKREET